MRKDESKNSFRGGRHIYVILVYIYIHINKCTCVYVPMYIYGDDGPANILEMCALD